MAEKSKIETIVDEKPIEGLHPDTVFPFTNDDFDDTNHKISQMRRAIAFPTLGILAIVGALLTILASGLFLHLIDLTPEWPASIKLTPSSVLSVIISANSICLHFAMSEGANIAWWYQTLQKDATVKDLHFTWTQSTSLLSAIGSGRKFSYISLATILLAVLPLDGLLLQSAVKISNDKVVKKSNKIIPIPFAKELKSGWITNTAGNITEGHLSPPYDPFAAVNSMSWEVARVAGLFSQSLPLITSIGPLWFSANVGFIDCEGSCSIGSKGFGFHTTCETTYQPYDLSLQRYSDGSLVPNQTIVTTPQTIYSFNAGVNPPRKNSSAPSSNILTTEFLSKTDAGCTGHYKVTKCESRAAIVAYYSIYENNVTDPFSQYAGLSTWHLYQGTSLEKQYNEVLPNYVSQNITDTEWDEEWHLDLTQIANYLNAAFKSSVTLHFQQEHPGSDSGRWDFIHNGQLSTTQGLNYPNGDYELYSSPKSGCSAFFQTLGGSEYSDTQLMFENLNNFMWFINVNRVTYWEGKRQAGVAAKQINFVNRYHVQWLLWIGSLLVTVTISAAVATTFWGFWRLLRKTTMSPFETARVFQMPAISGAKATAVTNDLLQEFGDINIHEQRKLSIAMNQRSKTLSV